MGTTGIHRGILIMVIKAISELCTCIHIVDAQCTFCSCAYICTENIMLTQCACIHVHVSYYGHEGTFWVVYMYTTYKGNLCDKNT